MFFVRDKGQMGNNILQYAHMYAYAREHNRRTVSLRFAYKYRYFRICKSRWHNFFVYVAIKFLAKIRLMRVLSFEMSVPYSVIEKSLHEHDNVVVEGWGIRFYDLFMKYRDEIVQMFAFLPKVEGVVQGRIAGNEDVRIGVHIRRGDYRRYLGGIYYYEDDTYIEAVRQAVQQAGVSEKSIGVYICSNDPDINKLSYQSAFPDVAVHFPSGNAGEDLCLLSKMDFLIGPPSTFSLVASMYKDTPIFFIKEKKMHLHYKRFSDYMRYDDSRSGDNE
ncbi:MAG: glycosyltransferase [Bacteroidaceae bacterium]|nr:glycosyltransferase [Bacteroidaceae bacterium]